MSAGAAESPADVAIITGAASGIGRATARLLAGWGLQVVGVDLDGSGLIDLIGEVESAGGAAHASVGDVSDDDSCRAAVEVAAGLGRLRVLVNVAGMMPVDDKVDTLPVRVWHQTLAVNVGSVFGMSRHAIPHLRPDGGVIVNTASVHAFATMPATAAYAASKGAIVALTRQMALDYASDGIRVVAVAPGSVDTPMSDQAVERAGGSSLEDLGFTFAPRAIGRVGRADEVAAVIGWLTSESATFVNGTTLPVDGALLARLV